MDIYVPYIYIRSVKQTINNIIVLSSIVYVIFKNRKKHKRTLLSYGSFIRAKSRVWRKKTYTRIEWNRYLFSSDTYTRVTHTLLLYKAYKTQTVYKGTYGKWVGVDIDDVNKQKKNADKKTLDLLSLNDAVAFVCITWNIFWNFKASNRPSNFFWFWFFFSVK